MTTETATAYDELRRRVLEGDTTVTATALEKARRETEYAELVSEAARSAAQREVEAKRQRQVAALSAEAAAFATDRLDALRAAYRAVVESGGALRLALDAYYADRRSLVSRAKALSATAEVDIPASIDQRVFVTKAMEEAAGKAPSTLHVLHDDEVRSAHRRQYERRVAKASGRPLDDGVRA